MSWPLAAFTSYSEVVVVAPLEGGCDRCFRRGASSNTDAGGSCIKQQKERAIRFSKKELFAVLLVKPSRSCCHDTV